MTNLFPQLRLHTNMLFLVLGSMLLTACNKKEHKVANPVAVEVYRVTVTNFPTSPPGGGTWDSEIFISDPYGRPDLLVKMFDNLNDTVGFSAGYSKLNSNHSNLPIGFDLDPAATVPLDRTISFYLYDKDDFDADDYIGSVVSDTLSKAKDEQPGYLQYTNGDVGIRFYIRWK